MDPWIEGAAGEISAHVERDIEALVAISSPSGDAGGAEECVALAAALAPPAAAVERVACSTPDHADDTILRLTGTGTRRLLLLGHLDTVVDHASHRPIERGDDERIVGSGAVDMKGGDALALGILRVLARRTADFAEVALLLVNDEEWRSAPFAHVERFAGWDACLCFEAGQRTTAGDEAVIVTRKAAATLRVTATGRSAHSGAAPERGRNALVALAAAAQAVALANDPDGPDALTAVPTIMRSGEAFNVVPARGELHCDLRAKRAGAFDELRARIPEQIDGVVLASEYARRWPPMDAAERARPLLAAAAERLGRPIVGADRGGASDASHFAPAIPFTVDGLGPRGGAAHARDEYVLVSSLRPRVEVALAIVAAALSPR
jgi:glutamate carboxypeptidase